MYRVPTTGRYPEGWYAHVWDTAGHLYPIRKAVVATTRADRYPPGQPIKKKAGGLIWYRDWSLPLTHEDPWELAQSRPGEIAKDIYRRVLDVQGSTGPLNMRHLQRLTEAPPRDYLGLTKAWWSPDMTMKRVPTQSGTHS